MLLTITNNQSPATDLGYLLRKNPARRHKFPLSFGAAHVFYPEASDERCTAALLVEVDPVQLVRGRKGGEGQLDQYVNDRPYAASSFLSVAIAQVFGSALSGRSKERPDLIEARLPLSARVAALPCRGGEPFLRRLFEPLGYTVRAERHTLDEKNADWGMSPYYTVELSATCTVRNLLAHIYVLVPVLDDEKHYWVGDEEVEKLLRHGEGWLGAHPARDLIASRYLKHRPSLVRSALSRLVAEEQCDPDRDAQTHAQEEEIIEKRISLNERRTDAVLAVLKQTGAKRVLDLGCGEGRLLKAMLDEGRYNEIVGMDVSTRALEHARERLHLERLPDHKRERIKLLQGSLTYRDSRLCGYDAATVIEVIEHLDSARLAAFERVLFEYTRPAHIVLTTPNVEYNVLFGTLPAGAFRHKDHRFEWTRAQFRAWAEKMCARYGYGVELRSVGDEVEGVGAPTQMGVFARV